GPRSRPRHVINHAWTDVEQNDVQLAARPGQAQPFHRIEHGKRLHRLWRVEVEPHVLVGEVEPWTDDGHAPYAARGEKPARLHRREGPLDRIVGDERGVEREAARAEQMRSPREFGKRVAAG